MKIFNIYKDMKCPYISFPNDNSWDYEYGYCENKKEGKFGVLSAGSDFKFDGFDKIEGDDIGFFMMYDDLKK